MKQSSKNKWIKRATGLAGLAGLGILYNNYRLRSKADKVIQQQQEQINQQLSQWQQENLKKRMEADQELQQLQQKFKEYIKLRQQLNFGRSCKRRLHKSGKSRSRKYRSRKYRSRKC